MQAPASCSTSEYRSTDGSCNNLKHPTWGMASRPYAELAGFHYADGKHELARALSGNKLPSARKISSELFLSKDRIDDDYNLMAAQYGQIIALDMGLTYAPRTGADSFSCCVNGKLTEEVKQKDKCAPIAVPSDDPAFGPRNISCFDFTRTAATHDYSSSGPHEVAQPISAVTSWLDLFFVYGNGGEESDSIRAFEYGFLNTVLREGEEWPAGYEDITPGTTSESDFLPKKDHVKTNPKHQLTPLQVLWWREHNRLALMLCILNPHWSEDRVFEEARRITIAQYQHITYNEYLPLILSKKYVEEMKLYFPKSEGCINDYDSSLDPSVTIEHTSIGVYGNSNATGYIPDQYADFRSIQIQRGRDLGVASYVKVRRFCGLPVPNCFEDLINVCKISSKNVEILKRLYERVDDVELAVGAALEPPRAGALCGETSHCVISDGFKKGRRGDRFFYQNCEQGKFTPEQLKTIQETTLSRIICFNSEIPHMQPKAFKPISKTNRLKSCDDYPPLRIHYWCEHEAVPLDNSTVDKIAMEVKLEERSNDTAKRGGPQRPRIVAVVTVRLRIGVPNACGRIPDEKTLGHEATNKSSVPHLN
ncbi:Peroxidase mlt-7 [Eumeta japonica]|uniref:Peroxidase mlt-7 n=1 Tax=Eumeta variegata TaxID=151549 RepID=A0A4C1WBX9_EUMVA|nr:Peroxidase mlt-7 [Eumeta japonica]